MMSVSLSNNLIIAKLEISSVHGASTFLSFVLLVL